MNSKIMDKPAAKPAAVRKDKTTGKAAPASRARTAADSLPNRVRPHREAANLSPKGLAQRLGNDWTASTVRRICGRGCTSRSTGRRATSNRHSP